MNVLACVHSPTTQIKIDHFCQPPLNTTTRNQNNARQQAPTNSNLHRPTWGCFCRLLSSPLKEVHLPVSICNIKISRKKNSWCRKAYLLLFLFGKFVRVLDLGSRGCCQQALAESFLLLKPRGDSNSVWDRSPPSAADSAATALTRCWAAQRKFHPKDLPPSRQKNPCKDKGTVLLYATYKENSDFTTVTSALQ